jgi:hypothetical protein
MGEPPELLDGARVLAFALVDESVVSTAGTAHRIGDEVLGPAAGLAIARYDGDAQFYLFYCDSAWQVVTDTCHPSLELAREQAEFEYRGVSARWRSRQMPDSSNFYSSLHTRRTRREVGALFEAAGWAVREPDDWDHLEVHCPWAELVIESESPILMHGLVADVAANGDRVLAPLRAGGVGFTAEGYGPENELVREWRWDAAEPQSTPDTSRESC